MIVLLYGSTGCHLKKFFFFSLQKENNCKKQQKNKLWWCNVGDDDDVDDGTKYYTQINNLMQKSLANIPHLDNWEKWDISCVGG